MTSSASHETINSEIDALYWQLRMTYSRLRIVTGITHVALLACVIHMLVSIVERAYFSTIVLQGLILLGLILLSFILFRRIVYIRGYFE